MWREGKDPFIDRHGDWHGLLLGGGGRQTMREYYNQEFKAGRKISRVALGWDDVNVGNLADQRYADRRPQYFAKFKSYVAHSPSYAYPLAAPTFNPLERIDSAQLTDAELSTLMPAFTSHLSFSGWSGYGPLTWVMHRGLMARGREKDLLRVIPYIWKVLNETRETHLRNRGYERVNAHIKKLLEDQKYELAAAYGLCGQTIGGKFDASLRLTLESARAKAVGKLGTIPVPPSDRRYKLFVAQQDFTAGNTTSAWNTYLKWTERNPGISTQTSRIWICVS
jgi:hypothetical protein